MFFLCDIITTFLSPWHKQDPKGFGNMEADDKGILHHSVNKCLYTDGRALQGCECQKAKLTPSYQVLQEIIKFQPDRSCACASTLCPGGMVGRALVGNG